MQTERGDSWICHVCTYCHKKGQHLYLACAICGTLRKEGEQETNTKTHKRKHFQLGANSPKSSAIVADSFAAAAPTKTRRTCINDVLCRHQQRKKRRASPSFTDRLDLSPSKRTGHEGTVYDVAVSQKKLACRSVNDVLRPQHTSNFIQRARYRPSQKVNFVCNYALAYKCLHQMMSTSRAPN